MISLMLSSILALQPTFDFKDENFIPVMSAANELHAFAEKKDYGCGFNMGYKASYVVENDSYNVWIGFLAQELQSDGRIEEVYFEEIKSDSKEIRKSLITLVPDEVAFFVQPQLNKLSLKIQELINGDPSSYLLLSGRIFDGSMGWVNIRVAVNKKTDEVLLIGFAYECD